MKYKGFDYELKENDGKWTFVLTHTKYSEDADTKEDAIRKVQDYIDNNLVSNMEKFKEKVLAYRNKFKKESLSDDEKLIGSFDTSTEAELKRRDYINKYFIPDVMKTPYIRKEGDKYLLIKKKESFKEEITIDLSKRSIADIKDILKMLDDESVWYSLVGHKLTVDEDEIRGNFDLAQQKFIYKESLDEDEIDKIIMDVPLLTRVLEYFNENSMDDVKLHKILENLIRESKKGMLGISDYENIIKIDDEEEPIKTEEEKLKEAYVPGTIKDYAKENGMTHLVNKVANWAEKCGGRIRGGTAIGKNYDTLILDLTYQGSEISINPDRSISFMDVDVKSFGDFKKVYDDKFIPKSKESLKESWADKFVNDKNIYKKLNWYILMGNGEEKEINGKQYVIFKKDNSALVYDTKDSEWKVAKIKNIDVKTGLPIYGEESLKESDLNKGKIKYNGEDKLDEIIKYIEENKARSNLILKAAIKHYFNEEIDEADILKYKRGIENRTKEDVNFSVINDKKFKEFKDYLDNSIRDLIKSVPKMIKLGEEPSGYDFADDTTPQDLADSFVSFILTNDSIEDFGIDEEDWTDEIEEEFAEYASRLVLPAYEKWFKALNVNNINKTKSEKSAAIEVDGQKINVVISGSGNKASSMDDERHFIKVDGKWVIDFTESGDAEEFKEGVNKFDELFDKYVPSEGKADSVLGEMLRAIGRLEYRMYHDGDMFFTGYGVETCGASATYLKRATPLSSQFKPYLISMEKFTKPSDAEYEKGIENLKKIILNLSEEEIKKYSEILNYVDSREFANDYKSRRYEDEEDEEKLKESTQSKTSNKKLQKKKESVIVIFNRSVDKDKVRDFKRDADKALGYNFIENDNEPYLFTFNDMDENIVKGLLKRNNLQRGDFQIKTKVNTYEKLKQLKEKLKK